MVRYARLHVRLGVNENHANLFSNHYIVYVRHALWVFLYATIKIDKHNNVFEFHILKEAKVCKNTVSRWGFFEIEARDEVAKFLYEKYSPTMECLENLS